MTAVCEYNPLYLNLIKMHWKFHLNIFCIISRGQQRIKGSWLINECVIEQRGVGRAPYI